MGENRDMSRLYIYSIFKYLRAYIFRIDKKYRLAQKTQKNAFIFLEYRSKRANKNVKHQSNFEHIKI